MLSSPPFSLFLLVLLPFSRQIAAAFDVLQKTIAGASALFYDFTSSLAPVESLSFSALFRLFLDIPKHVLVPLRFISISGAVGIFLLKEHFFTGDGALLLPARVC